MGDAVVEALLRVLGTWAKPPDVVAWAALALAALFLYRALAPQSREVIEIPRVRFVTVAAFAAAFLSLGYIAHYLRGGPRIIDATSYFLQGRAISHGNFAWTIADPSASFRGRFLLFGEPDRLAGIFPPGYPLLLAAGFLVGAPLVVGPLLAAALVVGTYALALEIAHDREPAQREHIARLAAAISIVCAAIRYHTSDTMAHGASAVAITIALTAALRARRLARTRDANSAKLLLIAGLAVGYVACTRLASALPIAVVVVALASRLHIAQRTRAVACLAVGMIPGLALLALANRTSTGEALSSTQRVYYATSDGPPGCFRYGFGAGTGCMFEHGDFVRARMEHGYGVLEALGTTVRRLRMHLTDVANFELLAPLVLLPLRGISRAPAIALVVVVGQFVAYAPFYFDGNYPGGGARLFADVLPIEHALLALSVAYVLPRFDFARRASVLLAIACAGFAVHASHDHVQLANRDGGRPMFEPDRLREAGVAHGLVFFETDNGFNLAHDPGMIASHGVVAARLRNDDHDKLLYDRLGHPPAHIYRLEPAKPPLPGQPPLPLQQDTTATVTPFVRTGLVSDADWRFEAEADWPPLDQSGGWAEPIWASGTCTSNSRALALIPAPGSKLARARIELPVPQSGKWTVRPRAYRRAGAVGSGKLTLLSAKGAKLAEWLFPPPPQGKEAPGAECRDLPDRDVDLEPPRAYLVLEAEGGEIALDRTSLAGKR